jgi:predicted helicase
VIVGNPPYSSGQDSANDDNANEKYPSLDEAIRSTYAERSTATLKNSLYDSYIRAIKWATLRIKDRGVIAFVTNGGWLDSNTADGMRRTLAEEFSSIHVLNLRGNQRTAGEQSRKEGGKVFGGGSRATVAITILVKNPEHTGPATVQYTDIGDYLTREEKLAQIADAGSVGGLEPHSHIVTPNEHGDWLNQRHDDYEGFLSLGAKGEEGVFNTNTTGFKSQRDSWVWNFSEPALHQNAQMTIGAYNNFVQNPGKTRPDATQVSWSRKLEWMASRHRTMDPGAQSVERGTYRPFTALRVLNSADLIDEPGQTRRLFPSTDCPNVGLAVMGPRAEASPAVLAVDAIPDLALYTYAAQVFARWRYESVDEEGTLDLGGEGEVLGGYRKIDNVTDGALKIFANTYGDFSKDDIFYYVYGLLHSAEYRETYAADLKKMLPRIPLVEDPWPFAEAGRALSELHLGYESVTPYALDGLDVEPGGDPFEFFRVQRMAFAKVRDQETKKLVADRSRVVYNSRIELSGIPEEAYRYQLGSRSAVEWILDRYQVKTDKASGIVNDPNDWSREVSDPRYIIDLLARIVTVSLETMKIVDSLPALAIREERGG